VYSSGFWVSGSRFRVQGFEFQDLGSGFTGFGVKV